MMAENVRWLSAAVLAAAGARAYGLGMAVADRFEAGKGMARERLDGRRVLVTGAGQGIGRKTAERLVSRGARVALVDRDADTVRQAADELGPQARAFVADVTDADALERAVHEAADAFGGLDVVVANAGIATRCSSTVEGYSPDELERVMAVNVTGAWNTARAGLRHLRTGGRLVIVASVYAYANGAFIAPYAASKAAVESLGRSLRVELAARGIGVTLAYFGPVDTGFARAFDEDPVGIAAQDAFPAALVHRITPEHAAAALVDAVARGRSRVITPRRWVALDFLRGPVARLGDRLLAANPALAKIAAGIPAAAPASSRAAAAPSSSVETTTTK
jgi:NAD(P)-dependent dehydrogenase (short-subunit alcohol dehydrogenase family)